MASFTYPQHLLHKIIEPQWFPNEKQESESILTILEAAEEAHTNEMAKVLPDKDKIIIIGQRSTARRRQQQQQQQRRTSEDTNNTTTTAGGGGGDDESTVVTQQQASSSLSLPRQERFWNRRRSTNSTAIRSQPSF